MHAAPRNNNKNPHTGRNFFLTLSLCLIGLLAAGESLRVFHKGPTKTEELEALLAKVQKQGGVLVRCQKGTCRDLKTREFMGYAQDGYYITYPDGTVSDEELQREADEVTRILK